MTIGSSGITHKKAFLFKSRLLSLLLPLLLVVSGTAQAQVEPPDEHYARVYKLIEQAESFQKSNQKDAAKARYQEAHAELLALRSRNPAWSSKVVNYRLNLIATELAKLSPETAKPVAPAPAPAAAAPATSRPSTPAPAASAASKPAASPAPAATSDTVKLLSAGAEPRQALRLKPVAGAKDTTRMTITMKMDMGMGQPMAMPPMLMTAETTVKSISPAGEINYEMTFTEASLKADSNANPQVVEAMSKSMKSMIGMTVTGVMSDRGMNKIVDLKMPANADPQSRQQMEQMKETMANVSTPFPAEPVGIGAKWEYKAPVKSQGFTMDQTTTYELVGLAGKEASVGFTIAQSAAKQAVKNPAMAGLKMELVKMTGTGSGKAVFNLEKTVAVSTTINSKSETSMKVNQGGKEQPMSVKTEMNLELESK